MVKFVPVTVKVTSTPGASFVPATFGTRVAVFKVGGAIVVMNAPSTQTSAWSKLNPDRKEFGSFQYWFCCALVKIVASGIKIAIVFARCFSTMVFTMYALSLRRVWRVL